MSVTLGNACSKFLTPSPIWVACTICIYNKDLLNFVTIFWWQDHQIYNGYLKCVLKSFLQTGLLGCIYILFNL